MKTAVIASAAAVLILAGIGVAYHVSRNDAAKDNVREGPVYISDAFRPPAVYALAVLEKPDASLAEINRAMRAARLAQDTKADIMAMMMLEQYQAAMSIDKGREIDKTALDTCRDAAHSLIEHKQEATIESTNPCIAAVHDQQNLH